MWHTSRVVLEGSTIKPVVWTGDSLRVLKTFPSGVQGRVYVLHVFQKKSKRGISTPQAAIGLIRQRLKLAVALHETWR